MVLSIAVVVVCVFASVPLPSSEEAVVASGVSRIYKLVGPQRAHAYRVYFSTSKEGESGGPKHAPPAPHNFFRNRFCKI